MVLLKIYKIGRSSKRVLADNFFYLIFDNLAIPSRSSRIRRVQSCSVLCHRYSTVSWGRMPAPEPCFEKSEFKVERNTEPATFEDLTGVEQRLYLLRGDLIPFSSKINYDWPWYNELDIPLLKLKARAI